MACKHAGCYVARRHVFPGCQQEPPPGFAHLLVIISVVMLVVMAMGALPSHASSLADSLNEIEKAPSGQPFNR